MRLLRKFLRLGRADRIAIIRATALILLVRAAFGLLPFRTVLRLAQRAGTRRASHARDVDLHRTVWAVDVVGKRLFPRNPCLTQAVVVQALFRRGGRAAQLRIGVRKAADASLEAHAWVESEGRIVIGGAGPIGEYVTLPAFQADPGRF